MTNGNSVRVVAAGDHFILPSLIREALDPELTCEVAELTLGWPLDPFGPVAEVTEASDAEDELIEALAGAQVLVTQMGPVTERVLDACPDLRLVVVCRGGPVNVNLDAAKRHDVRVCYAPGRNAAATAEFTVGLMLAALRRIPQAHDLLARQGSWEGPPTTPTSTAAWNWRTSRSAWSATGPWAAGSRACWAPSGHGSWSTTPTSTARSTAYGSRPWTTSCAPPG